MFNPFHFTSKCHPINAHKKLLCVIALSGFSFTQAVQAPQAAEYALVNTNGANTSFARGYSDDLAAAFSSLELIQSDPSSPGTWLSATLPNINLGSLRSTDSLRVVAAHTLIIEYSSTPVYNYDIKFTLPANSTFNSTLKIDAGRTVEFELADYKMTLTSNSKLEGGVGSVVKFSNLTSTANAQKTIESSADLSGFYGTLNIGANTLELKDTTVRTLPGSIAGTGALNKTGSGALTVSGPSSSYSGPVTLSAGTTTIGTSSDALGTGALTISAGATLDINGKSLGNSALTLNGGTLSNSTGSGSYANSVAVDAASNMTAGTGSTLDLSGVVSGSAALTLDGAGTVKWGGGANTYTGTVSVNAGTLELFSTPNTGLGVNLAANTALHIKSPGATPVAKYFHTLTGSGTVYMESGSVILNNATAQTFSGLLRPGNGLSEGGVFVKKGAGTLTLSGTNIFTQTAVAEGPIVFGANNALGSAAIYIQQGGSIDLAGYNLTNYSITFGAGGGKLLNSSTANAVSYSGNLMTDNGISTEIGGTGNISLTAFTGSAGATITKIGAGTLTLSPTSSMRSKLRIMEGSVEVKGVLQSGFTEAVVGFTDLNSTALDIARAGAATLYIDGAGLLTRKVINTTDAGNGKLATISGAGTLHLRNGWIDLRTSNVTVANVNIHAAVGAIPLARVMIDETFNPTGGTITIDGILEAHISNTSGDLGVDYTLENTITGTGLLKKYGAGTLALTGDLTNFTGGVQVYEGTVRTGGTAFANSLELYTGATLISDLTNTAGSTATLSGNLFGSLFTNDGLLHLGNNSTETQILSFTEFQNRGQGIYVNNNAYGHVRVNALTAPAEFATGGGVSSWGAFFVPNGTLAFNGKFLMPNGATWAYNYAYAYQNGQISLDPGSTFEGSLAAYSGGTIRLQATNIDAPINIDTINTSFKGILDIGVDKINATPSTMTVKVESLRMFHSGVIVLRPDVTADQYDAPLLTINEDLYLPTGNHYSYYPMYFPNDTASTINILPTGTPANNNPITVNLLKLGGDADTEENRAAIISYLKTGLLYDIESPAFDVNGLLSCTLRYKQPIQLLSSPTTSIKGMPDFYQRLARSMLQQHSNTNDVSKQLYNGVANSNSSFNTLDHLRSFAPAGALPTCVYQSKNNNHPTNIINIQVKTSLISRLADKNPSLVGKGPAKEHPLFQKMFAHEVKETERYKKYAENSPGPHLESFRTVNLDGLSFDSQLQYQHQKEPNRSEDEIGYSSHSWTASLGASYSKKNRYSIGTLVSTTKNNEKMNANDISKTGKKEDRLNTIGALGYYNFEKVPVTISGLLSYGQHNYDQTRTWSQRIVNTNELLDMSGTAQYKAYATTLQSEVGYTYTYSNVLALQPFVGATWTSTHNGSYQEASTTVSTGAANNYGYIVPAQNFTAAMYSVGVELVAMKKINDVESLIFTRLGVSTQKNSGETSEFRYALIADPDAELTMSYQNYRYNTADILIGVYTTVADGVTLTAVYNANIGKDIKKHNASLSVDYAF